MYKIGLTGGIASGKVPYPTGFEIKEHLLLMRI